MKLGSLSSQLVIVFTLSGVSLLGNVTLVVAQSSQSTATKPSPSTTPPSSKGTGRVVLPALPPGPAPGGRRYGGARRGECTAVTPPLTALVPSTENTGSVINVWGQTTAAHPKLWFYQPYAKNSAYQTEFVILDDESKDEVYKSAIALPEQAGIIGIALPTNVSPLQVDKRYRWFLNVYCDRQKKSVPIYVEGVIWRKTLNQALAKQLEKAQPLQQVAIYAKNGFWHDALTILAELRQQNPDARPLQVEWTDFLKAIGLQNLAAKPLIQ